MRGVYRQSRIRDDIPADIARCVGRFIVKWAGFEYRVQSLIWDVAGVGEALGRIAIREPRIADRLKMLADVSELAGLSLDKVRLEEVIKSAGATESKRDLLAHSPWTFEDGHWKVISFRGNLSDPTAKNRSRKINPESFLVTTSSIGSLIINTESLTEFARACTRDFEKLSK